MSDATKQQDGYRWMLRECVETPGFCNWTGFGAKAQKRCTMDSGRVYYQYVDVAEARFDTAEARDKFLANYTAKQWATKEAA